MPRIGLTKRNCIYSSAVLLLVGAGLLFALLPPSLSKVKKSVVRVEARSHYEVVTPTGDTLTLPLSDLAAGRGMILGGDESDRADMTATFVSNTAHLLTSDSLVFHAPDSLSASATHARIVHRDSMVNAEMNVVDEEMKELDYYAHTHSVVDDGFNAVMEHRVRLQKYKKTLDSLHIRYAKAIKQKQPLVAHLSVKASASVCLPSDSGKVKTCRFAAEMVGHDVGKGLLLLQLKDKVLPEGTSSVPLNAFSLGHNAVQLVGYADYGGATSRLLPSLLRLPAQPLPHSACEGSMVLSAKGHVKGMWKNGQIISLADVHAFLYAKHLLPVWKCLDIIGWVRGLFVSAQPTSSCGDMNQHDRQSVCSTQWPGGTYFGQVMSDRSGKWIREGHGQWQDSLGTLFRGEWHADTLTHGERVDSLGIYSGDFDARLQPEGTGTFLANDGEWYEGEWRNGLRDGHGYSVKQGSLVRCGSWRKGRFLGERMVYTADRVYGIDLSRYQHEIGKKKYGIQWNRLRITSLGNGRRVNGSVDYPVSFVYIKATQGTRISNKYYPADIRQARKYGIPVGSYHFYSSKANGSQQAAWFLRMAWVVASDLPPVLDLEPTEAQIREMGGEQRMFREVLRWLHIVEQRRGKRPVLYVGQQFVNKHLVNAPDALKKYDVWIARYGEFKPYVHLLHWQLTPYGRVKGIHGEVDVNVFNGTKSQFRDYLTRVSL